MHWTHKLIKDWVEKQRWRINVYSPPILEGCFLTALRALMGGDGCLASPRQGRTYAIISYRCRSFQILRHYKLSLFAPTANQRLSRSCKKPNPCGSALYSESTYILPPKPAGRFLTTQRVKVGGTACLANQRGLSHNNLARSDPVTLNFRVQ